MILAGDSNDTFSAFSFSTLRALKDEIYIHARSLPRNWIVKEATKHPLEHLAGQAE